MADSNPATPATPAAAAPTTAPVAHAADIDTVAGLRQITAQQYVDRGVASGRLLERQTQQDLMRDLISACPGKPELAINGFLTGQSPASVKLAFDAAQAAEQHANTRIAQMELDHARAMALASAGGHPGVAMGVNAGGDTGEIVFAPDTPPETQAKMEWDSNFNNCRHSGATEKQYALARINQLSGAVRVLSRK